MRSWISVLLIVLLASGAVFYLIDFGGSAGHSEYADLDGGEASEGDVDVGPTLAAMGHTAARVPAEIRGRGWIQGVVRRGGQAIPARVDLRHVSTIDPRNPMAGGIEKQMIARILDSGVSVTKVIGVASAGEDGRFKFRGLAPGVYEVRGLVEDGGTGFARAHVPAYGARVGTDIDVPAGELSLKGRIVYADQKPFVGMVVLNRGESMAAIMLGAQSGGVRPGRTDEGGRFEIGGLLAGPVMVSAIIPGRMRAMGAPVTLPHDGEYLLTVDSGGAEVKGRVISAATEAPIAGAAIFGGGGDPNSSFFVHSTTSDVDGRFAFTLPAGQGGGMIVRAAGYAPENVELRGGAGGERLVALVAHGKIRGRVTAKENGSPVRDVTVFATGNIRRGGFPLSASTVTDADGRYMLEGVSAGSISVHGLGAGWVTEGFSGAAGGLVGGGEADTPFVVEVEAGAEAELDLVVVPGSRATGRVATVDGEPIVGAVVEPITGDDISGVFAAMLGIGASFGAAVTDAEGRYEIDILAPGGTYKLTVRAPEYPEAASHSFTAVSGKTETVDIEMKAPRWLQVTVVDAAGGTPIVGARVHLSYGSEDGISIEYIFGAPSGAPTNSAGQARVGPVREGPAKLRVTAPGYVALDKRKLEDGQESVSLELRRGLVIAGRMELPEGVPARALRVVVERDGQGSWVHEQPTISADGSFRVDTLKDEGDYKITAKGEWESKKYSAEMTASAGRKDLVLYVSEEEVDPATSLMVKVIGADGKAVSAGVCTLHSFREGRDWGSTSGRPFAQGEVTFREVKTDRELWLEVHDVVGSENGALFEGPVSPGSAAIELQLPTALTISGRVLGPEGRGVLGIRVAAHVLIPARKGKTGRAHGEAVTNAEGYFTLKHLGELDYELRFKTSGNFGPVEETHVRAGAANVTVRLKPGAEAVITVLDYAGKPVAGAMAHAALGGSEEGPVYFGSRNRTTSGSDGTIHLRGLDAQGPYTLRISPPEERDDLKDYAAKDWVPSDLTVRLARDFLISGTVRDADGKPVERVRVTVHRVGHKDGWGSSVQSDENGAFSVDDLEAGRYEISVQGSNTGWSRQQEIQVTVPAGTRNVALVFDRGARLTVVIRDLPKDRKQDGRGALVATVREIGANSNTLTGAWTSGRRVSFEGLDPEKTYELWIGGLPGGRYVHENEVRAQAAALELDSSEGLSIRGTVRLPDGVAIRRISLTASNFGGASVVRASTQADPETGAFLIEGLPPGKYGVYAHAWDSQAHYGAAAPMVAAGGEVNLTLEKKNHTIETK